MRFGINLRGDLAKLDDVEIAARYERLIAEIDQPISQLIWHGGRLSLGRGLLHAKAFYELQINFFRFVGICMLDWITDEQVKRYLLECEFKDVRDELKRRVQQRQLAATS